MSNLVAQEAVALHKIGIIPLPLGPNSKRPLVEDWTNFNFNPNEAKQVFAGGKNLGVILGRRSGGLADVDLDCPEAVQLAHLLPKTNCTFGRASRYVSHQIYCINGDTKTIKFLDPLRIAKARQDASCREKAVILELRGDGCQTMFPPSIHPEGEAIEWRENGQPATVERHAIVQSCIEIVTRVIVQRHGEESLNDPIVKEYLASFDPQKSKLSERAKATAPSQIADNRKAVFGTAALQAELNAVSSTPEGGRNARLFEAGVKCASLAAGGCLDAKQAQAALLSAAQCAGLTKAEAVATIQSAWLIGAQNPRTPQNRQLNTDHASRRQKMHDGNSKTTPASLDDEDNEILPHKKAKGKPSDDEGNRKTTEELLDIAAGFQIFCDLSGEAYVTLREADGVITAPLASRIVRDVLVTEYHERTNKLAAETQVKLVIELLSAKARRSGHRRKVNLRVGEHNGAIYLDLGKKFVEISQDGWKIVSEAPIPFRRPPAMQPLPEPTRGGSIQQLNKFLNIVTEQDFQLIVAFLHAAIRPMGPYPILCVTGENGSAKSSLCELLARLIDPQSGHKLKIGNSEDQTFVLGENRWMMDFDNLSGISADASDTLCRIATGASLSKRKLYSDSDQHLSTICRPIIANGIDSIATRNDFADRAIVIALRRIPEEERRPEEEIRNEFVTAHPAILGALLDGIVEGLRRCSTVKLSKLPRMADFARWAVACETAHWPNGGFEKAYFANAVIAGDDVVANDEVAQALIEFMDRRSEWSGTAAELKTELEANLPDRVVNDKLLWPRTAVAMGKRLNRVQTTLRRYGIEIDRTRECGGGRVRTITIRRSEPDTFQPDAAARTAIDEAGTNKVADRDKRDKYELSHLSLSTSNENNKIEGGGTGGTNKSPKTLPAPAKEWRIEL